MKGCKEHKKQLKMACNACFNIAKKVSRKEAENGSEEGKRLANLSRVDFDNGAWDRE